MKKAVCFGEILLRLCPVGFARFVQADSFDAIYGGAEANTAVSLANYGVPAAFVSKVPENEIGQSAINSLRRFGVDTTGVVRGGERLGLYYLEKGASQRPSKVIYDRKHSAIAEASAADFDWEALLSDAGWFHITGITPALSDELAAITLDACKQARQRGIPVSCDVNFRQNLWSSDKAGRVMRELMPYVDLAIVNEEHAEKLFGIKAGAADMAGDRPNRAGYQAIARALCEQFGCRQVAITMRTTISANVNRFSAMLYTDGAAYFSREYTMDIVDRIGGGDSFSGGLIYALLDGMGGQAAVEFAAAAGCLKHSIEGDTNLVSAAEVLALANGDGSARVQR